MERLTRIKSFIRQSPSKVRGRVGQGLRDYLERERARQIGYLSMNPNFPHLQDCPREGGIMERTFPGSGGFILFAHPPYGECNDCHAQGSLDTKKGDKYGK